MKKCRSVLLATLVAFIFATGCAPRREVTVGVWGPGETPYYARWEHETHREHVEWESRNDADHRSYWEWRKHHHD